MGDHNHNHHDHSGHHNHHQMPLEDRSAGADPEPEFRSDGHGHEMKMYFHGGYTEVILFDSWRIDSLGGLIGRQNEINPRLLNNCNGFTLLTHWWLTQISMKLPFLPPPFSICLNCYQ